MYSLCSLQRKIQKTFRFSLILVLLISLSSCEDDDLRRVSESLRDTSHALSLLQTTVIEANKVNLLSTENTRSILEMSIRVNHAGQQAVDITRGINRLSPEDRNNLLNILIPIVHEVGITRTAIIFNIQNPETRNNIDLILLTIQSSLNATQLILATR